MSDSPVKKLDFQSVGKENAPASFKPVDATTTKPVEKTLEVAKVAPGVKETEANEPLLQENPHRFVLFPIKYHEVSHVADASTRKVVWTWKVSTLHNQSSHLTREQYANNCFLSL